MILIENFFLPEMIDTVGLIIEVEALTITLKEDLELTIFG